MRRVRIERKQAKTREERSSVLRLDPRDPDVVRAKHRARLLRERA